MELITTIPIFIICVAVLVSFLVSLYLSLVAKDAESYLVVQNQLALSAIQDDLYFARNFAEQPSSAMVDADAPSGSASNWTYNTSPPTLIVYEMALDKVRQDPTREIVYQQTSASGNSCAANDIELNPPVLNNLIYYVDSSSNLRRRVLVADPINPRCSEPFRTQTCTTTKTRVMQTSSGQQTVNCPADVTLATGVKDFEIEYYDIDNNIIDISAGGSPLQAERITLKLTTQRTVAAKDIEHSSELTITKVNRGDPNIQ